MAQPHELDTNNQAHFERGEKIADEQRRTADARDAEREAEKATQRRVADIIARR